MSAQKWRYCRLWHCWPDSYREEFQATASHPQSPRCQCSRLRQQVGAGVKVVTAVTVVALAVLAVGKGCLHAQVRAAVAMRTHAMHPY